MIITENEEITFNSYVYYRSKLEKPVKKVKQLGIYS